PNASKRSERTVLSCITCRKQLHTPPLLVYLSVCISSKDRGMRYALLVLIVAGTARETHAQGTPIQNGVPYHVGTDGVVYLHGPTEVTAGTSSSQWIQPCPQEGMWNAPPANC